MQTLVQTTTVSNLDRTQQRITILEARMKRYRNNMELIKAFLERRETLRGKGYTYLASCSSQTPDDKARGRRTLQNLQLQITLLELECRALKKYGI